MKKITVASIITLFCAFTCAFFAGTVSAQKKWEKIVTLQSGEVVLDISGEWDSLTDFSEAYKWLDNPEPGILLITQEGTTFSAVKQTEDNMFPKGTEKLKGELDKNGFKEVQLYIYHPHLTPKFRWVPVTWEISENGNKIVFVDKFRVKYTLTRR